MWSRLNLFQFPRAWLRKGNAGNTVIFQLLKAWMTLGNVGNVGNMVYYQHYQH